MINTVIFDIGGVIVGNVFLSEDKAAQFATLVGADVKEMREAREHYWDKFKTGKMTEREFWAGILSRLGQDPTEEKISRLSQLAYSFTVPLEENVELVKELREEWRYRLITLNDEAKEFNDYRKQQLGLENLFEFWITSCDVGCSKPDKKIYEIALERLKEKPETCVFIDDQEENLFPARDLGIHAIHYQTPQQLRSDLAKLGVYVKGEAIAR